MTKFNSFFASMSKMRKKPVLREYVHFLPCRIIGLHVNSIDSNVTKSIGFQRRVVIVVKAAGVAGGGQSQCHSRTDSVETAGEGGRCR